MRRAIGIGGLLLALGCVPDGVVDGSPALDLAVEDGDTTLPPATTHGPDAVAIPPELIPVPLAFDGVDARAPLAVFLNRSGGTFQSGGNDSSTNASFIVQGGARTVPAYSGSSAQWTQIVDCVRGRFAGFNVAVTTTEPAEGAYVEVVVGGEPSDIGYDENASGVAPVDSETCVVLRSSVAFVFADKIGSHRTERICESIAHEVGHTASLDHAFLCEDPMSYLFGCGAKTFQDTDAACGESEERACSCGRASQNSVEILHLKLDSDVPLAQLRPTQLTVETPSVRPGESARVRYARSNDADDDAGRFADGYFLTADRTISQSDDRLLRRAGRPALPANTERGPYTVTLDIPEDVAPGAYWIAYWVDYQNAVEESVEDDNILIARITIAPPCDGDCEDGEVNLRPSLLEAPTPTVAAGASISVRYERSNDGTAGSPRFADGYYLSTNSYISTADRLLVSSRRGELAAGATAGPFRRSLTIPADVTPGTYWIGYWVDHEREVEETSESDNRRAVQITVR